MVYDNNEQQEPNRQRIKTENMKRIVIWSQWRDWIVKIWILCVWSSTSYAQTHTHTLTNNNNNNKNNATAASGSVVLVFIRLLTEFKHLIFALNLISIAEHIVAPWHVRMHTHTPRCAREMRNAKHTQNRICWSKMFAAHKQRTIILLFNEPHRTFECFSEFYARIKWLIVLFKFSSISFQMNTSITTFCNYRKFEGNSGNFKSIPAAGRISHTKNIWRMSAVSSLWMPAERTNKQTKTSAKTNSSQTKPFRFHDYYIGLKLLPCTTKRIT